MLPTSARTPNRPGGRRLRDALPQPQEYSAILTPDAFLARVSPDLERDFGPAALSLHAQPFLDLVHADDHVAVRAALSWLRDDSKPVEFECRWQRKDGNWRWLEWTVARRPGDPVLSATARDVTRWREDEALAVGQARVLERIVAGAPLNEILDLICITLETASDRMRAAVHLIDSEAGILRLEAGPSLDATLKTLLATLPLEGGPGAAVAAARSGEMVAVGDLTADTLWMGQRDAPLASGVRAEWALGTGGRGDGVTDGGAVVAAYLSVPGEPTPRERQAMGTAAALVKMAIGHSRDEGQVELLAQALGAAGDVVMVLGAKGREEAGGGGMAIRWVNAAFQKRLGIRSEQALGQSLALLQGPETDATALERIERAVHHGVPVQQDLLAYGHDAAPLWLELDVAPVKDANGHASAFIVVGRDVTGPKLAEEALARSEEHVGRALAAAGMATLEWDAEHRGLDCSDTFGPLFGLPHGACFGSFDELLELAHPDDRAVLLAFKRRIMREKNGVQEVEWRTMGDSGSARWLHARVRPERDRAGRLRRVAGVVMVRGAAGKAAEGAAEGAAGKAAEGAAGKAAEGAAAAADQAGAAERIGGLDVLDLSALIAGWSPAFRAQTASSASLHLRLAPDVVSVFGDADMLRDAITELVRNAAEALAESGGVISLATGTVDASRAFLASAYFDDGLPPGRYAYVEISDTGHGMDAAVTSRMFDPTYSTHGGERGAGLSRVLHAVRSHHGAVQVYSKPDIGTTVRVLIPTEVLSLSGRIAPGIHDAVDTTRAALVALTEQLRAG